MRTTLRFLAATAAIGTLWVATGCGTFSCRNHADCPDGEFCVIMAYDTACVASGSDVEQDAGPADGGAG